MSRPLDMDYLDQALKRHRRTQKEDPKSWKQRRQDVWRVMKQKMPFLSAFNFILWHYCYLIAMIILGTIIVYPIGGMSYTDALFLCSGGVTQSGLNTIDLNLLKTSQQITLLMLALLCNPISINTFVVFLRLYWFEKKFRHIVQDSLKWRQSRIVSRTRSMDIPHVDLERGLTRQDIRVLHPLPIKALTEDPPKSPLSISSHIKRDIMFADELPTSSDGILRTNSVPLPSSAPISNMYRMPVRRPTDQHIRFVENQRDQTNKPILRIPGPRDVELGSRPEKVDVAEKSPDAIQPNEILADDNSSNPDKSTRGSLNLPRLPHLRHRRHRSSSDMRGVRNGLQTIISRTISRAIEDPEPQPYLSYTATIGRNSLFVDLTEDQREELGGIEYRALKTLFRVLLAYNFGWLIFGIIVWLPWILHTRFKSVVEDISQSPVWWGIFTPVSHFTDLGFTLTPDSMISFQTAVMPMLVGAFLIIIGNTGFPCMLRFTIWFSSLVVPAGSGIWEEFRFLLDHPRRCFTLLFPRKATWWLFAILIILNGIDLIFFVLLDIKNSSVFGLPRAFQFLAGLYQAASTRTAGFAAVNLANLNPGIQVSYLIMMYISVFPIALSIRQTNVYEENSLGIYAHHSSDDTADDEKKDTRSYLGSHFRRQLSFDLWFVFLGLFLLCIFESDRIQAADDPQFTIWPVLFEAVSAYGTVGLSLGYPGTNTSFAAQFGIPAKLVLVAMMIRGRHRGLPYALDRAILLPGEGLKTDKSRKKDAAAAAGGVLASPEDAKQQQQQEENHQESIESVETRMRRIVRNQELRRRRRTRVKKIIAGALTAGPVGRKKGPAWKNQ